MWCGVHAYGLWRRDPPRAVVLVLCAALFFTLWGAALWVRSVRRRTSEAVADHSRWNVASLIAFMMSLVGVGMALAESWILVTPPQQYHRITRWVLYALLGAATLSAVIGLSHPNAPRGKMLGIATLVVVALLVLTMLVFSG